MAVLLKKNCCAKIHIVGLLVADQWRIQGVPPARTPPLRVQILSFWHTNFSKCSHLGSWRPPYEVGAPPTGNPGSATADILALCVNLPIMGFKARVVLSQVLLHLLGRVTSGVTPAFSTVYACIQQAGLLDIPHMQTVKGSQWWIVNLGSNEMRSRTASSINENAVQSTTPVGFR